MSCYTFTVAIVEADIVNGNGAGTSTGTPESFNDHLDNKLEQDLVSERNVLAYLILAYLVHRFFLNGSLTHHPHRTLMIV